MKIVDIAAAAGVSASTVCRVISGNAHISQSTVELVRRVIAEMGSDIDQLRAGKNSSGGPDSDRIAVLTFPASEPMDMVCLATCLQNISVALSRHNLRMFYLHCPQTVSTKLLREASGYIFLQGNPSPQILSRVKNKIVISLFCRCPTAGDQVLSGNYDIGRLAAQYFVEKKLQDLVFLSLLSDKHPYFAEQGKGFKLYCQQAGIYGVCEIVREYDDNIPSARFCDIEGLVEPLVHQLIYQRPRPLGVFVPSCWLTVAVYRLLLKRNIIPDAGLQFICTGFQSPFLAGLYPAPAIIDFGLDSMVEHAVNLLMLRLKLSGPHHPLQLAVSPTLIEPTDRIVPQGE